MAESVTSQPNPIPAPFPTEKTFSAYSNDQGKAYAQIRRDYHPHVYETVINQHKSTGGQLDTLLDVGCGPGNVARALAPQFAHVIGLDPSDGMLTTARSLSEETVTSTSQPILFEVSTAEDLGKNLSPPIQDSSVDLIVAGNAAHWFDMSGFWQSAARVLKPGGSVALWCSGEIHAHPSMPNAAAIQTAIDNHHDVHLTAYTVPGNLLARDKYVDLPLPWTLPQPVSDFDESTFYRKDWEPDERFFVGQAQGVDLGTFEKMMGTSSAATRWRQAHPDAVGTEQDVIRLLRREMERILQEAGVEKGHELLKGVVQGAVLVVKKKA